MFLVTDSDREKKIFLMVQKVWTSRKSLTIITKVKKKKMKYIIVFPGIAKNIWKGKYENNIRNILLKSGLYHKTVGSEKSEIMLIK